MRVLFLVAFAATGIACNSDRAVQPNPASTPVQSVLTSVLVLPDQIEMDQGGYAQLLIVAHNQRGEPMDVSGVTYESKAPTIASVSSEGLVSGLAPGSASISVTVTAGAYQRTAVVSTYVNSIGHADEVALNQSANGWMPEIADIKSGAVVRWKSDLSQKIYLMKEDYTVVDSVYIFNGSGTRRFPSAGVFHFCSGICWDPPDWGTIKVHQSDGSS